MSIPCPPLKCGGPRAFYGVLSWPAVSIPTVSVFDPRPGDCESFTGRDFAEVGRLRMIDGMITVTEASQLAGCDGSYIRRLLREGRLRGKQVTPRLWLVSKADTQQLKKELSTRSIGQRNAPKKHR